MTRSSIGTQRLTYCQTVSAIYSFFLAVTLHPEIAKKAQAEIDSVVGNDRLPTFADREHLPYLDALVQEVFRWNSVVPTGTLISSSEIHKFDNAPAL